MADVASDSDIEDASQFNPEDWIGKGRKVPAPADSPTGLASYIASLAEIPSDVSGHSMPGEGLTIEAFLQHVLPVRTYSVVQVQAKECFSHLPPNDYATALVSRTLPSHKLVENLVKEFRQAVLDGMKSVVDPDYPDSRLPLWGITFWNKNWEFHAIQETWREGLSWLNNQLQTGSHGPFEKACRYTSVLRWNETTWIPGAKFNTTYDFARFLSNDRMMTTTQIDMMFSDLSDRIELDESIESYVRVETLRFWRELDKAKSSKDFNAPSSSRSFLGRLEGRLQNGEIDYLLFPVYLAPEKYWLTFKLDFESHQLSYGDSLSHKGMAPKEAIRKIQWWLESRFERTFKDVGDELRHGDQEDYTDCGIVAANTAACELFLDEELWTPERKALERVSWFNKLVEKHVSEVNGEDASPRAYGPTSLGGVAMCEEALKPHQGSNTLPQPPAHLLNSSADQPNGTLDLWNIQLPIVPELANDNTLPIASNGSSLDKTSQQIHPFFTAGHAMDVDVVTNQSNLGDKGKKRPLTPEPNDEQPKTKAGKLTSTTTGSRCRGQSKSAIWARRQNEKYQQGKLKDTGKVSMDRFKFKISQLDQYAVIMDSKTVRHITCGKSLTMKAPFDVGHFKTHVQKCSGPPKSKKLSGAGMLPLTDLFKKNASLMQEPCPGLDKTVYSKVAAYLDRTDTRGGGASSVTVIADEMYGKDYAKLSDFRKKAVQTAQQDEWKWINNHETGKVFSTKCSKMASSGPPQLRGYQADDKVLPEPCQYCRAVLDMKSFRQCLSGSTATR